MSLDLISPFGSCRHRCQWLGSFQLSSCSKRIIWKHRRCDMCSCWLLSTMDFVMLFVSHQRSPCFDARFMPVLLVFCIAVNAIRKTSKSAQHLLHLMRLMTIIDRSLNSTQPNHCIPNWMNSEFKLVDILYLVCLHNALIPLKRKHKHTRTHMLKQTNFMDSVDLMKRPFHNRNRYWLFIPTIFIAINKLVIYCRYLYTGYFCCCCCCCWCFSSWLSIEMMSKLVLTYIHAPIDSKSLLGKKNMRST